MFKALFAQTDIGPIGIAEKDGALTHIFFGHTVKPPIYVEAHTPLLCRAAAEIQEYLDGHRREFDLPLAPAGTAFELAVWAALGTIPYGETRSYSQIAEQIGRTGACRAVGRANGRNPLSIIIPCHRVIGAAGGLTGYAGGLEIKKRLLELEQGGRIRL